MTVCFAAGVVPVIIGILCLTADVGRMINERARLQNAADAAVLAGTYVLFHQQVSGADEVTARAAALAEARSLSQANSWRAGLAVEFGRKNEAGDFEPVDTSTRASAVRALAFRNGEAPGGALALAFAGLFGGSYCEPEAVACAEIGYDVVALRSHLAPFGIPYDERYAQEAATEYPEEHSFYPCDGDLYDEIADKTTLPGAFGLLNLDGGDLGMTEIIDWINFGYDGEIALEDTDGDPETPPVAPVPGTSGFRVALQKAMLNLVGTPIIIATYNDAYLQGANATFDVCGFVVGTITDVCLTGNDPHINFVVSEVTTVHDATVGESPLDLNLRKIQLFQ